MNFPARVEGRLRDLNRVNSSFQGAADYLHNELSLRVDTKASSCEYLLGTNALFRITRQFLILLSYLERSAEIPTPLLTHFSKMIEVVINDSKPQYVDQVTKILDEWIGEIELAGAMPVHFGIHFAVDRRKMSLFNLAMDLRAHGINRWTFREFY